MKQLYDEYLIEYDLSPGLSGTKIVAYECYDSPAWDQYYELYVNYTNDAGGNGIFYKCLNYPDKREALFQLLEHRAKAGTQVKTIFGNLFGK